MPGTQPGFFMPANVQANEKVAINRQGKKNLPIGRYKYQVGKTTDWYPTQRGARDPIRPERYWLVGNRYHKVALRHSQVYEACANIKGGMSIYAVILAHCMPK